MVNATHVSQERLEELLAERDDPLWMIQFAFRLIRKPERSPQSINGENFAMVQESSNLASLYAFDNHLEILLYCSRTAPEQFSDDPGLALQGQDQSGTTLDENFPRRSLSPETQNGCNSA